MHEQGTTIVIFGITGDLAQKKILPALYGLHESDRLHNVRIVGFSRRELSESEVQDLVERSISASAIDKDKKGITSFLDIVSYVSGQFDDPSSYQKLSEHISEIDTKKGARSNKLFYLSVPPTLYEDIAEHISHSGLDREEDGRWARLLIEKPFGRDLESAQKLDSLLLTLFAREQIFRIDHYVAKDSLQKIITFRREDSRTRAWNNTTVKSVEINLFETAVVGNRGAFYDTTGALRDVGQNHMLQMLALVAMDIPKNMLNTNTMPEQDLGKRDVGDIHIARADILSHLAHPTEDQRKEIIRGQYEGYREEPGVGGNSTTETFFSVRISIDTPEWTGVPFVLTSGKALDRNVTEIMVTMYDDSTVSFEVPGRDSLGAYERIILDSMLGDQRVFISSAEILAQWAYITPLIQMWHNMPLIHYKIGSKPKDIVERNEENK